MEEKIMHLLITEDDMALAQGLQRALQEKNQLFERGYYENEEIIRICNFMCSDSFPDLLWLDGVCDHNYGSS